MKESSAHITVLLFIKIEAQQKKRKKVKSDLHCGSATLWTNIQVKSFIQCLFMAG